MPADSCDLAGVALKVGSAIVSAMILPFVCLEAAAAQSGIDRAPPIHDHDRARSYFGDDLLIDQDGTAHRFYTDLLERHVVLVNVVFASCRDSCPLQTQRLRQVRLRLGERFGSQVVFLSLSVDPERDRPHALKQFAMKQGVDESGWRFLTAERAVMANVLRRLGQWTDDPSDHSTMLIAGRASKRHWVKLRPDAPVEYIAAQLIRLAEE